MLGEYFTNVQGPSALVESIQKLAISQSSATINTTISAIDLSKTLELYNGEDNAGNLQTSEMTTGTLQSTTNLRTTAPSAPFHTIKYTVLGMDIGLVKSVQRGGITIGSGDATATATISAVDTDFSVVFYQGNDAASTPSTDATRDYSSMELTDATTVTMTRGSSPAANSGGNKFTVVEFQPSAIESIQPFSVTLANAVASNTAAISSVTPGNCMTAFGGWHVSANANDSSSHVAVVELTDATTVTVDRGLSVNELVLKGTIIEFKPAIIESVQRGTITYSGTSDLSEAATISSVDINFAVVNWLGVQVPGTTNGVWSMLELTDATTVTADRLNVSSTHIPSVNYEVIEFKDI